MRNYYGASGSNAARVSERAIQLRVRQRLLRIVRAAIAATGLDWTALPRGQADLAILAPPEIDMSLISRAREREMRATVWAAAPLPPTPGT